MAPKMIANAVDTMSVATPSCCNDMNTARMITPALPARASVGPPGNRVDQPADDVAEHDAEDDDHDRRHDARDVAHELREDLRERIEPERIRSDEHHREHHEPEQQARHDARVIEMRAGPVDRVHHAALPQDFVQADALEHAQRAFLHGLRQQVACDQDGGGAEKPGDEVPELRKAGLESVGEIH